jgi:hypothetical protein
MVWLGQPVLDPIYFADHVKAHLPRVCRVPVARLLGELNATRHCRSDQWRSYGSIRQDRVDAIMDCLEPTLEELRGGLGACLIHELRDCKLAGSANTNREIEFALDRLNFRDIDMKEADRVTLELLALRLVALDIRQARDPVPLKVRRVRKRSGGSFSPTQDAMPTGSTSRDISCGNTLSVGGCGSDG